MSTPTTIVIFDGECNLCNGTVDFLIRRDHRGTLRFGSFQHPHVAQLLQAHNITEAPTTVYVLLSNGVVLTQSNAILHLGIVLGGVWKFGALCARALPQRLRDGIYTLVANNRYRWFGRRSTCRVPTSQERSRFIAE